MKADVWQNHVYDVCKGFVGEDFEHEENEATMSINQREAYIIMKALEDQQKYLNPQIIIKEKENE